MPVPVVATVVSLLYICCTQRWVLRAALILGADDVGSDARRVYQRCAATRSFFVAAAIVLLADGGWLRVGGILVVGDVNVLFCCIRCVVVAFQTLDVRFVGCVAERLVDGVVRCVVVNRRTAWMVVLAADVYDAACAAVLPLHIPRPFCPPRSTPPPLPSPTTATTYAHPHTHTHHRLHHLPLYYLTPPPHLTPTHHRRPLHTYPYLPARTYFRLPSSPRYRYASTLCLPATLRAPTHR